MATVTADLTVTLNVSDTDAAGTAFPAGDVIGGQYTRQTSYAAGVTKEWSATPTLAAAATTYDLTALTGPRGSAVSLSSVRLLVIDNPSAFPLVVGGAANPFAPWSSAPSATWTIPANSRDIKENKDGTAWAVAGGAKTIKLDPGANTITPSIYLLGS